MQHGEIVGLRNRDQRYGPDPGKRLVVGLGNSPSTVDEASCWKAGPSGRPPIDCEGTSKRWEAMDWEEKRWEARRSASSCVVEC